MYLKLLVPADFARKMIMNSCSWTRPNVSKAALQRSYWRGCALNARAAAEAGMPEKALNPMCFAPGFLMLVRPNYAILRRAFLPVLLHASFRFQAGGLVQLRRREGESGGARGKKTPNSRTHRMAAGLLPMRNLAN